MKLTSKTVFQSDSGATFERQEDAIADEIRYWLEQKHMNPSAIENIIEQREFIMKVLTDVEAAVPKS